MSVRRVVTGHNKTGDAIFLDDTEIAPLNLTVLKGFATHELWSTGKDRTVPFSGELATVEKYFPDRDGSVLRVISFPPMADAELNMSEENLQADMKTAPMLLSHLESEDPAMHTTDSIDYGIVLQGEISLELDNNVEKSLKAGDVVIQNGTRHAWRNRSNKPAVMAFILLGATRI
jgi:mannose-6-phosphate isomerase-like protein (cupin superfamily)